MRIIYMHHAERKIGKDHTYPVLKQKEDITDNGIKEAELLAERFKGNKQNIKAIYTSPYIRCRHTAEIINRYLNVPIYEDERFNEAGFNKEEKKMFLIRNMKALDDIVKKYDNDDNIICVTSGVNFTAFVCYFYDIVPTNDTPYSQAFNISPVNFRVKDKEGKYDYD